MSATIIRIAQYQPINHVTEYLYNLQEISIANTGNPYASYAKLATMVNDDSDVENTLNQIIGACRSMIVDTLVLGAYGFNTYDASTLTIVLDFHSVYGKVKAIGYVAYKTFRNDVT